MDGTSPPPKQKRKRVLMPKGHDRLQRRWMSLLHLMRMKLDRMQKDAMIKSFSERSVVSGLVAFDIMFRTGEPFTVHCSIKSNAGKQVAGYVNISSRLSSIAIDSVCDLRVIIADLDEGLQTRKRGYDLERAAFFALKDYILSKRNDFIYKMRRGSDEEDALHGKDFILECEMHGQVFEMYFDLKNKRQTVIDARDLKKRKPSIFATQFELEKTQDRFIGKVRTLAEVFYRMIWLKEKVNYALLHVIDAAAP